MAKFYKAMCLVFLAVEVAVSYYLASTVMPVYTAIEKSYNAQFSTLTDPTGFNVILFIGSIVVSVFIFSAAWCFGNIADAAKKYLKSK